MGMGPHGFFHLFYSKMGVRHAVGHAVTLFGDVHQPEFDRVDAQFFRQFVDDWLHGKGPLGLPGCAVGLDFLFVADHVVAVHQEVGDVVGSGGAQCAAADG